MDQGYSLIVGAMSMDGWLQFSGVQMVRSYLAQEMERIQAKHGVHTKN